MVVEVGKQIPASDSATITNIGLSIPILVFGSIALYNVVELNYMVLGTFRRRKGLYFWSLIVAAWGIAVNTIGYLLEHLHLISNAALYSALICIGWVCMVTGQSVVLYSRLHLVLSDDRIRRAVLYMIVFDAIAMHIPVIVLVFGSNSNTPDPFFKPYSIYEKIQLTVFFIQECIISGLYVWETIKLLRVTRDIRGKRGARRVLGHLIFVNIVVIVLDISVLALEFSDYYDLQTGYKPLVYSIKLKMELSILNRLVELTRTSSQGSFSFSNSNSNDNGASTIIPDSIMLDTFQNSHQRRPRIDLEGQSKNSLAFLGSSSQHRIATNSSRALRDTESMTDSPIRRERIGRSHHANGPSNCSISSEHDVPSRGSMTSIHQYFGIAV
ncbi:integral membrane protein [Pestalotiopsis sp. NC0098]|nr:integral membrane protein [Pestalotiopsis sp. NC0098]